MLRILTLLISVASCVSILASERPNILVILADDQGWGDLSLHGNQNLETPNLDRLAEEGAQFRNFYVQPVCSPTRAEFLTGRYYPRSGVYSTGAGGERIDADEQLISEVFRDAGYATGAFGKWHSGTQAPYHPLCRGFDDYLGFTSGHWGSYFDAMVDHNGTFVASRGYLPDALTSATIEFIEKQSDSKQPFFAYLAFPTPHSPMQTTDEDWERFKNKDLTSKATHPDQEDSDHSRAALAMVENIDYNVGRLLKRIHELDIEKNTIVVYFTDNGPNGWRYNGGMSGRKGSTDEGGVRSPLFIRFPKAIPSSLEVETIAGSIDLLPTLKDLAGVKHTPAQTLDGISLGSLLTGAENKIPERILINYWSGRISARSQNHRLDHNGKLYDIESDRTQSTNIANQEPDIVNELQAAIENWKADILTPDAINKNRPLTIGYPGLQTTQLPARDAGWTGNIKRSNRWPNCSYLTNWNSDSDRITFNADVGKTANYKATLYYTATEASIGTTIKLKAGDSSTTFRIQKAHTPEAYGMEYDRVPRQESYVKDFAQMELGEISLREGATTLELSANFPKQGGLLEFRMLILEKR